MDEPAESASPGPSLPALAHRPHWDGRGMSPWCRSQGTGLAAPYHDFPILCRWRVVCSKVTMIICKRIRQEGSFQLGGGTEPKSKFSASQHGFHFLFHHLALAGANPLKTTSRHQTVSCGPRRPTIEAGHCRSVSLDAPSISLCRTAMLGLHTTFQVNPCALVISIFEVTIYNRRLRCMCTALFTAE